MSKVLVKIKELGSNTFKTRLQRSLIIFFAVVLTGTTLMTTAYSDNVNKGLASNLVRLHVVANSDSQKDQALKMMVRDAVLEYMKEKLKDSDSIEETRNVIRENIQNINNIAKTVILEQGENYTVETRLGDFPFPTKSYGDITLPAGYYQALKVVIGNGEGANWWCVLFPPLCFVDATHGTLPDSVKNDLKKALTTEEYSIVTSVDSEEDIPVRLKFKIVEILQDSKIEFSGFISNIFKKNK